MLTDALRQLAPRDPIELAILHGAGRTDAGVHADGQVANFQTGATLTTEEFARAFNSLLPPAIRVLHAEEVSLDFHARHQATAKTYRYRICRSGAASPFNWRYVLHYPGPLDFAAMSAAAREFEGHHDFATFAASTGSEEDDSERLTQRTILSSQMVWDAPNTASAGSASSDAVEWVYEVRGRSFLRNMVRKIAGTLLEVGRGRLTPEDIPRLIAQADRTASGPTAPPQALCLHSVEY
jgi:tRNA pseudouridine38-40 synthase